MLPHIKQAVAASACEHVSLELRPKTIVKLSAVRTNEGRLFQTVGAHHENRRATMCVNEDCVDSRSDVDDLRTNARLSLLLL